MALKTYSSGLSSVVLFITLAIEPCVAQTATSTTVVDIQNESTLETGAESSIPGSISWFSEII